MAPSAPAVRITFDQEAQYRRWAKDPVAFACEAIRIESKGTDLDDEGNEVEVRGKVVPFKMRDYQQDCMRRFLASPICVVLKARQIGLTTIACALALWLLLFHPNRFILVLSKKDSDAKKFFRRIRQMYERLDPWVKARAPQLVGKWGVQQAEFDNGSTIYSYTSAADHGRGDTPTEVFLDEIGQMRNADDSWTALSPATEDGGKLWIFGTAQGYGTWFHEHWKAWKTEDDVDAIFYGRDVTVPGRDEAWEIRQRRRIGDAKFRQEYPLTDDEAFVASGSNVFDIEILEAIELVETPSRRIMARGTDGTLRLLEDPVHSGDYGLFVFEDPIPGAKYLVCGDPAEGLAQSDPSAAHVLRWEDNSVVQAAVLWGLYEPDEFADQIHVLAQIFNLAKVVIERNNHGISVLKRLSVRRTPNVIVDKGRAGLWTSTATKAANIVTTRRKLGDGELVLRHAATVREMMSFHERVLPSGNVRYEGSGFDDLVDALCLGVGYADAHSPTALPPADDTPDTPAPFSLDWFMAQQQPRSKVI